MFLYFLNLSLKARKCFQAETTKCNSMGMCHISRRLSRTEIAYQDSVMFSVCKFPLTFVSVTFLSTVSVFELYINFFALSCLCHVSVDFGYDYPSVG